MPRSPTALALVTTLSPVSGAATAQQQFDGKWTIVASPEKSNCKRTHRYPVVIDNEIVRSSATKTEGRVQAGGRIQGSVPVRRSRVDVTGSLSERSGAGTWAVSGRMNCSGRWRAEKQG